MRTKKEVLLKLSRINTVHINANRMVRMIRLKNKSREDIVKDLLNRGGSATMSERSFKNLMQRINKITEYIDAGVDKKDWNLDKL